MAPNLFDSQGSVTPVGFHTGVWYMSPYFGRLRIGDDALMASWCKNATHGFRGLTPGAKYGLSIYLLQKPPQKSKARPSHRAVCVSLLDMTGVKRRRDAKVVLEKTVDVPALSKFEGYQIAGPTNSNRGNVLLFSGIPAGKNGRIDFPAETPLIMPGRTDIDNPVAALHFLGSFHEQFRIAQRPVPV